MSFIEYSSRLSWLAIIAALFITDSICAHEKPLNFAARFSAPQSEVCFLSFEYSFMSSLIEFASGKGTVHFASKRQGRINASSNADLLFVAATTRIPLFCSNPSNSFKSAVTILVFSVSIAEPE